jgi:hypothetical protein
MGPPALVARVPHVVVSSQALAPGSGTPPAIRRVQPEVAGRRDNDDACLDRAAAARAGGSVLYDSNTPGATEKLITRML